MPNLDRQCSISFEFGIELCMKKLMIVLLIFVFVFGLTACGKKDDIVDLSKDLSTYNMDISLDTSAKSVQARLDLTYVNNTDAMLDEVRFHLYPQFFEEGATEHVVSNTKLNDAYPNGMSYAEIAQEVKKSVKYVDNALQRIRRKAKKVLGREEL